MLSQLWLRQIKKKPRLEIGDETRIKILTVRYTHGLVSLWIAAVEAAVLIGRPEPPPNRCLASGWKGKRKLGLRTPKEHHSNIAVSRQPAKRDLRFASEATGI